MTILVMGYAEDPHADHIFNALKNAGADVALLDTSKFPTLTSVSWYPEQSNGTITLPDNRTIALTDITAVYWRTINSISLPEVDSEAGFLAKRDCMSTLRTFFKGTKARWVNSWQNFENHKEKPLQLSIAHDLGIKLPKTLISNNANDVIDFVSSLGKDYLQTCLWWSSYRLCRTIVIASRQVEKGTFDKPSDHTRIHCGH